MPIATLQEMSMAYRTLISATELAANLGDANWAVIDCRFSLADTEQGRRFYLASHIPGAIYAHMDEDLSGPVTPGKTGRHPLPEPAVLAEKLSAWGVDERVQVVAYDDSGGSMAARLWWLLRWLGHDAVAVVDGGWPQWQAAGLPVTPAISSRTPRTFAPRVQDGIVATAEEIMGRLGAPGLALFDARTADRYRGENETIDPVAGHIPGSVSAPYPENLQEDGRFQPAPLLRERFAALLQGASPQEAIFYCGSGVTAAHNVLAVAHAGLGDARLYAGSWSEWITDPNRPVAAGPNP
jgi:thiosulfate/3-mercaptopyruvate sulfurtransferase